MSRIIEPGRTLGVLGGGQLGRMFVIAAKQMGYRVQVFTPVGDSPAGQVADVEIHRPYEDLEAVKRFAQAVDVVTLEFENIPVETVNAATQFAPVHPGAKVLQTAQNRLVEKAFMRDQGIAVADFRAISSLADLKEACQSIMPGVLKTATGGYDGKGQVMIRSVDELESAWESLNTDSAVLEAFVEFDYEVSVIAVRNGRGEFTSYPPIRNIHRNHILDVSISPSGVSEPQSAAASKIAGAIMEGLGAIGVVCVEFFVIGSGELIVNEIAPRPHNSGHLTIDAHATSQFEQQVRAVCGLKLGAVTQHRPSVMLNLLGECWEPWPDDQPPWSEMLSIPEVHLHLYGKSTPKAGRKMGHLTALAATAEEALANAHRARDSITASTT